MIAVNTYQYYEQVNYVLVIMGIFDLFFCRSPPVDSIWKLSWWEVFCLEKFITIDNYKIYVENGEYKKAFFKDSDNQEVCVELKKELQEEFKKRRRNWVSDSNGI